MKEVWRLDKATVRDVYEALRTGACGFVLKDDPPDLVLAGIRFVAGGEELL